MITAPPPITTGTINLEPFREAAAGAVKLATAGEVAAKNLRVLAALNAIGAHNLYAGTANPRLVAKRHAKNKVAKQSRKTNRG